MSQDRNYNKKQSAATHSYIANFISAPNLIVHIASLHDFSEE